MAAILLTSRQREGVRTTGRGVIVSAAAGSGKTAVLAERCAYLVCDAPEGVRCDVDALLVLTFTDAAAAEMRSRIIEAMRRRLQDRPHDARLREQVALVDAARISTIHSFCLWLVRRWFSHAGVDPAATVMDADEAKLLESEVLDTLFAEQYATVNAGDDPLGGEDVSAGQTSGSASVPLLESSSIDPRESVRGTTAELGRDFIRLVDHYGLGEDRDIAQFILKLFDFTASLPAPLAWLRDAYASVDDRPEQVLLAMVGELELELDRQIEHCEKNASLLEASDQEGHFHASQIRAYVDQLRSFSRILKRPQGEPPGADHGSRGDGLHTDVLASFDVVRQQIADFEFSKARAPALPKDVTPATRAARDMASARLNDVKKRLLEERLRKRFAFFSAAELAEDLRKTAPYVGTLVNLMLAFGEVYARKKRELNVFDFADLERLAFGLLCSDNNPGKPSEVASTLHRRFAHVLVDEFQDINPIQEAIIRLVSREVDPDRADNLFVVGDVKQSIYRFRLAEPSIFTDRLGRGLESTDDHAAIFLQHNFRSRPEILEAVNLVFRPLMRGAAGEMAYNADAELRVGREFDVSDPSHAVELHLLERSWENGNALDEASKRGVADPSDPAHWTAIEREAYLIGSRIRAWMNAEAGSFGEKTLRYGDIVVLLRAAKINAERMTTMLTAMGIPAYADVGGSLFGAREIRDVLAALQVLDNVQQDIPLVALLRNGMLAGPFSVDDLTEIRCLDHEIPFHAAVRAYVDRGDNADLRDRLRTVLDRIDRCRAEVRRRPLADVLWNLYQAQGYLAYAGGLPNGAQRRANLLKLHELARRFGSFRRQGLHRFLRFIQSLQEEKREVATAPSMGETDDVVRLMSIHQAKGLEFPIVFIAGLGTRFNLGDRSGRMIFDRASKIGLRVVDSERMVEYASAAHGLVASEVERTAREEELRILYVAMTRAQERLVLVGSERGIEGYRGGLPIADKGCTLSRLSVATAMTPLDWLIPVLLSAPPGVVRGLDSAQANRPLFDVHLHDTAEMAAWRAAGHVDKHDRAVRRVVARLQPLPRDEPVAPDDPMVDAVISRIETVYPELPSASIRASMAASEFKGTYDFTRDPELRPDRVFGDAFEIPTSKYVAFRANTPAHRGLITHRVLQHLDFAAASDQTGVAAELQRMVSAGLITTADVAAVDRASIEWFASTPLAEAIRSAGDTYHREFPYIAVESVSFFDRSIEGPPEDKILVRGIVDGILPVGDEIDIVDFKTDAIPPEAVAERSERYRPQMELYARAMSRLWRRPVRTCYLVFLDPRVCHALHD